jgi:hypothetical protein
LLVAIAAAAQSKHKTDAQVDGFEGAIHAVSTHMERAQVNWHQPLGPMLVMPIFGPYCEYASDGSRTRSGVLTEEGEFVGEEIKLIRDGFGQVIERTTSAVPDGWISRQEKTGPFGPIEATFWAIANGPAQHQTFTYDRLGYLAEESTFDAPGNLVGRTTTRTNEDGQWTEHAGWSKNSQLEWRETYDPETDFQRFETYDDSGAVQLSLTFSHDKVQTFWAATDDSNQFGSSITANKGDGDVDYFTCHKGGECDVSHVHYTYADSNKQNPSSVQWRNSEGVLLYASRYEYEFDDHHNWTKRTVWLRTQEISEGTLYETDTRVIITGTDKTTTSTHP